ncbi:MAG: T9SS type A sorting domain-containing protein [Bacteroidota bacterium]
MKLLKMFVCFFLLNIAVFAQQALTVKITSPQNGATVSGTVTVSGTSTGATAVSLSVDHSTFEKANGLNPWDVVFEPGSLSSGSRKFIARAENGSGSIAFDSISVTVSAPPPGSQSITYHSSVDGEALTSLLWVPKNFNPQAGKVPLFVYLHGGGGLGTFNPAMTPEFDSRGWIALAPDGRRWKLAFKGCSWQTSAAYVDNPNPDVGPGERDILDAITWAKANFPIDEDRIYLSGFSMGGRGTYIIGLKNPDLFAAIAPLGPASDMYEIFVRRPEPAACKEGMTGGKPGDSPFVNTMYTITSGRFLVENAYNLPVYHGHGTQDGVANNIAASGIYLHGAHMLMDTSWNGCHGSTNLCFGHTPTLSELRSRHPDGYDWAFMFTPVPHQVDSKWVTGTTPASGISGVVDPQNPGKLIGMMEFLSRRTRVNNPKTVVYKSYTDKHRKAYWLELDITTPWTNKPGAIRTTRKPETNALEIELSRADTVTFDLARAALTISKAKPLTLTLKRLVEPIFDPALESGGETLNPTLVLSGAFSSLTNVTVHANGVPLSQSLIKRTADKIGLGPITLSSPTTLLVFAETTTSVYSETNGALPTRFALEQNYPNPFNPETTIEYEIPSNEKAEMIKVTLKVYDALGREVATLVDEYKRPGKYSSTFYTLRSTLPSGVYFYQLTAGKFSQVRKAVLIR